MPKSNQGYWEEKLTQNQIRDQQADAALAEMGWRVFVVWECEVDRAVEGLVQALRDNREAA
jgi:DNA mismatch endonuclease (patch repair protein)